MYRHSGSSTRYRTALVSQFGEPLILKLLQSIKENKTKGFLRMLSLGNVRGLTIQSKEGKTQITCESVSVAQVFEKLCKEHSFPCQRYDNSTTLSVTFPDQIDPEITKKFISSYRKEYEKLCFHPHTTCSSFAS